jgi:hypothetical protein
MVRLRAVAGSCGTCGLLPGSLNSHDYTGAGTGCTEGNGRAAPEIELVHDLDPSRLGMVLTLSPAGPLVGLLFASGWHETWMPEALVSALTMLPSDG